MRRGRRSRGRIERAALSLVALAAVLAVQGAIFLVLTSIDLTAFKFRLIWLYGSIYVPEITGGAIAMPLAWLLLRVRGTYPWLVYFSSATLVLLASRWYIFSGCGLPSQQQQQ